MLSGADVAWMWHQGAAIALGLVAIDWRREYSINALVAFLSFSLFLCLPALCILTSLNRGRVAIHVSVLIATAIAGCTLALCRKPTFAVLGKISVVLSPPLCVVFVGSLVDRGTLNRLWARRGGTDFVAFILEIFALPSLAFVLGVSAIRFARAEKTADPMN